MLTSLSRIIDARSGILDTEADIWLAYLLSAEERIVNMERVRSIEELQHSNPVLEYVERTLEVLERQSVSFWIKEIVEEVLIWSETAKGGTAQQRLEWQRKGMNLYAHNLGSAELYLQHHGVLSTRHRLIHCLIRTHGLLGQHLRGEVSIEDSLVIRDFIVEGALKEDELSTLLITLNHCIIEAVSPALWQQLRDQIVQLIHQIACGQVVEDWSLEERFRRLRFTSIRSGENFAEEWKKLLPSHLAALRGVEGKTLWYVEAALGTFQWDEFVKLFLYILKSGAGVQASHLSFERLMTSLYYDYKGEKKVNVYKKRMIEKYLKQTSLEEILGGHVPANDHLHFKLSLEGEREQVVFVELHWSAAAEKLIEFCVEAEKSPLYEKAVLMLFDLFELRRDAYDRFHNEEQYLRTMNQAVDDKRILLDYLSGDTILDIGPGGGVILDLVEDTYPNNRIIGIDISQNVIEALQRKKQLEQRSWEVIQGDALNLKAYLKPGEIQTVIFSSILHELYSYIEYEGRRFNHATVGAALKSAFDILPVGGRLIIRDGIMTEPKEQMRIIRFKTSDGMSWLERYAKDFEGRKIGYDLRSPLEVKMKINDCMEFLYTYTWGPDAYIHEVQEQFGYFTPTEFIQFIQTVLGPLADIIVQKHFLQPGYTAALADKIEFFDDQENEVELPDSTCIFVIEKKRIKAILTEDSNMS